MLIRKFLISAHVPPLHSQPAVSDLCLLPTLARGVSRDSFCLSLHPGLPQDRARAPRSPFNGITDSPFPILRLGFLVFIFLFVPLSAECKREAARRP